MGRVGRMGLGGQRRAKERREATEALAEAISLSVCTAEEYAAAGFQ